MAYKFEEEEKVRILKEHEEAEAEERTKGNTGFTRFYAHTWGKIIFWLLAAAIIRTIARVLGGP